MSNQQLANYIKSQLSKSVPLVQIRNTLLAQGWAEADIRHAFHVATQPTSRVEHAKKPKFKPIIIVIIFAVVIILFFAVQILMPSQAESNPVLLGSEKQDFESNQEILSDPDCDAAKVDKDKKTGVLTDSDVKKLDDVIRNPSKFNLPGWMLNRRKDYETSTDQHLLGPDLKFSKEGDIKRLQKIKSFRGMRHAWKLPLRGQRTRSNFRPNKGKVMGVKKRKGVRAGRV